MKGNKFTSKDYGSGYQYALWELGDWVKYKKYGPKRKPPRKLKVSRVGIVPSSALTAKTLRPKDYI